MPHVPRLQPGPCPQTAAWPMPRLPPVVVNSADVGADAEVARQLLVLNDAPHFTRLLDGGETLGVKEDYHKMSQSGSSWAATIEKWPSRA